MTRGLGALAVGMIVMVAGCADDVHVVGVDLPPADATTTTRSALDLGTGNRNSDARLAKVATKVTASLNENLVMSEDFDRRFLTAQFGAIGLQPTEAECVVGKIAEIAGADFGTRSVKQLGELAGKDPSKVFLPCVPAERLGSFTSGAASAPMAIAELRPLLSEVLLTGLQQGGLTESEADCVSRQTLSSVPEDQLASLVGGTSPPATQMEPAFSACLTAERIGELSR